MQPHTLPADAGVSGLLSPHASQDTRLDTRQGLGRAVRLLLAGIPVLASGCSVLSYSPTVELVKAAGLAANKVASVAPNEARDVVQHPRPQVDSVCIEFNRGSQAPGVVPALQVELQQLGVDSRVYDASTAWPDSCRVWLHYTAFIDWDVPTFGDRAEPYLSQATLTLRADGRVLASAAYELDGMGLSKWSTTRQKLAPLVKAVIQASPLRAGQAVSPQRQ